ncbi:MAG: hypothetical protein ACKOX6_18655 [Bdellovibrio sp.]
MNENITRRDFFFKFLKNSSPALKSNVLQIPENPFPGRVYWDHKNQNFEPVFSVDAQGNLLHPSAHLEAFLSVLVPPPSNAATWNSRHNRWYLPLGEDQILTRMIVGDKIVRECHFITSQNLILHNWSLEIKKKFPQLSFFQTMGLGKTEASDLCPEDVFTLVLDYRAKTLNNIEENFKVTLSISAPPLIFLKLHMTSGRQFLKILTFWRDEPESYYAQSPDLPEHIPWASSVTLDTQGQATQFKDYYFYSTDQNDVESFCQRYQLSFPQNILELDREVHFFGVTYDLTKNKPVRVKRYYQWWMQ